MAGESFIESDIAAQLARNEKLVEVVEQHGADLDEVRPVDFFFYANSSDDAAALAHELTARGFRAQAGEIGDDGKWPVYAILDASVHAVTAPPFVEQLVRLAANYLAEFDGWGTPV